MREQLVQIFCKLPEPGKVKTRLAECIGDVGAADVAAGLAKRTISRLSKHFRTEIWYSLEDTIGFLDQFLDVDQRQQVTGDLGERMRFALVDGLSGRYLAVRWRHRCVFGFAQEYESAGAFHTGHHGDGWQLRYSDLYGYGS